MNSPAGRILVVRGGAIGDFVLTLPVFAALRSAFPQAEITVLGYPAVAELARLAGTVDAVRPLEGRGMALFFNPETDLALPNEEAAFFAGFDIILSYLYDPDGFFQRNVARISQATFLAGPHRPAEDGEQHATEALLAPLQSLAIFDADPVPRLPLEALPAEPDQPPRFAVHPGSGSPAKNWPEALWRELLAALAPLTPARLLVVAGEAEAERAERLATVWPADRCERIIHRPLSEVAGRLAGCAAFLGHDSGITHLAAACGVPCLALWGPSNEVVWRPQGPHAHLLHPPGGLGLDRLPGDLVLRRLTALLAGPEGA